MSFVFLPYPALPALADNPSTLHMLVDPAKTLQNRHPAGNSSHSAPEPAYTRTLLWPTYCNTAHGPSEDQGLFFLVDADQLVGKDNEKISTSVLLVPIKKTIYLQVM